MNLCQRQLTNLVLLASSLVFFVSVPARGDEPIEPIKVVQGKWVRRQTTPNGPVIIVKEHKEQKTIVTAYDDQKNVIYSHESEFKIEQMGKVRVFTFFNRTLTAGPNAGQKIKEPVSFIFRVDKQRFVEVNGLLDGDTNAPNLLIWERMEEVVKDMNAASLGRQPPRG